MAAHPRQPRPEAPKQAPKLYLSFDCAEKSLAWALLRVETPGADAVAAAEAVALAVLRRAAAAWEAALGGRAGPPPPSAATGLLRSVAAAAVPSSKPVPRPDSAAAVAAAERVAAEAGGWMLDDLGTLQRLLDAARGFATLVAGSAADLSGGAAGFLPPVRLARALAKYLRESVDPHVEAALAEAEAAPAGAEARAAEPKMWVGIEWQMGANVKSRRVHTMLLAHYAGSAPEVEPMFVPATLKNSRIVLSAHPDTSHAAARKKSKAKRNYGANKAHAVVLADRIAQSMGFKSGGVWGSIPARWRPDFSDAFLQALVVARMDPGERRRFQDKF